MAKRKNRPGGIELIINRDGSVKARRFGPQRPRDLTAEELRPWLALAYSLLQRDREAAKTASPKTRKAPARKKAKAKRRPKGGQQKKAAKRKPAMRCRRRKRS